MVTDRHDQIWLAPAPLWPHLRPRNGQNTASADLSRPAILRFETDEFMEELFALVAEAPTKEHPAPLAAKIARWKRFSEKPDDAASDWATRSPAGAVLKLFQPVHGHFHLVTASLVCEVVGRPDHTVPPAQVGFVMRRLAAGGQRELAWVPMSEAQRQTAADSKGEAAMGSEAGHVWKPVPAGREGEVLAGEVVLPAFAVPFTGERGQPRKLWAALIPASSPEARLMAKIDDASPPAADRTFVLRAVLQKPHCLPPRRFVMSERSEVFRIASFVDRDAPARAAVIPMPDTSIKSLLARFPKRAKFLAPSPPAINAEGEKPKDMVGGELPAEVCTMSIPIITLCAYILLSIILSLLNILFFWLPFVKFCFPMPAALRPEEE